MSIGRAPGNRIRLGWDAKVSREHARIEDRAGWRVIDLGPTNGTWRNGERLRGSVRLGDGDGDVLRCGETVLFVRLATAASPDGTKAQHEHTVVVPDA